MSAYYRYPVSSGGSSGTVTSVGLADTSTTAIYTVSGSPVTTSGTIDIQLNTQSANQVFAGPSSGSPAQPTFRSLVANDVPALSYVSAVTGTAPVVSSGGLTPAISMPVATTSVDGYLSHVDWNTFNNKQPSGTYVTSITGTSPVTSSGGTTPAIGITGSSLTESTSSVLTITGGSASQLAATTIQVKQANTSQSGYLSNTDWNTFNGKQASGNYITALTGDGTASGPGSAALTLATVNSNTGSFGSGTAIPNFTVNGKGLITAAGSTSLKAPTVQKFTSGSGTYTLPSSPTPLYIKITAVGAGGGGAGGGTTGAGAGGTGGNTTFGTTLLVANGGAGGSGTTGGAGGSASLGTGPVGVALSGGAGCATPVVPNSATFGGTGGAGGVNSLGGQGAPAYQSTGGSGVTNTGAGGAGGGISNVTSDIPGSGGGAGGYIQALITSPSSTYSYAVGAAGTAGSAGTSGSAGGAGGSGLILVEEFYQ